MEHACRRHVEKVNFIVLLRKNVSSEALLVIKLFVSMMVSVVEMRVVSVVIVSMVVLMTKISVVLSQVSRQFVLMIIL